MLQFCSSWQHLLRNESRTRNQNRFTVPTVKKAIAAVSFGALFAAGPAIAQDSKGERDRFFFWPGILLVSRSAYDIHANNVKLGEIQPPNCANTTGGCGAATGTPYNGTHPFITCLYR